MMSKNEKGLIDIIDLQKLTTEQWTFEDIFPNKDGWKQSFLGFMENAEADIQISIKFKNAQKLIESIYLNLEYDVIRFTPASAYSLRSNDKLGRFEIEDFERKFYEVTKFSLQSVIKKGVPDYLMVKRGQNDAITRLFFIEVKSEADRLSYDQLQWMVEFKLPVYVAYVHRENSFNVLD